MDENLIQIVDEHDNPIGRASKEDAWKKGLIHRIIRVMIRDEQGRLLLQKRSLNVKVFPGLWDNSVGGHVDMAENYADAALRELHEELGLQDVKLKDLGPTFRTSRKVENKILNRFNKFYTAEIKGSARLNFDPYEVAEVRWFTLDEIKHMTIKRPDEVTDGIRFYIQKYTKP